MGTNINKKIVVIGGSGFLGKSLLKLLLNENAEIVLFTRKKNYKEYKNFFHLIHYLIVLFSRPMKKA